MIKNSILMEYISLEILNKMERYQELNYAIHVAKIDLMVSFALYFKERNKSNIKVNYEKFIYFYILL